MKRLLPLVLAGAMMLTTGATALADNVSDALEKAATMTNDELYAKAQEEMAAARSSTSTPPRLLPRKPPPTSCRLIPLWMAR